MDQALSPTGIADQDIKGLVGGKRSLSGTESTASFPANEFKSGSISNDRDSSNAPKNYISLEDQRKSFQMSEWVKRRRNFPERLESYIPVSSSIDFRHTFSIFSDCLTPIIECSSCNRGVGLHQLFRSLPDTHWEVLIQSILPNPTKIDLLCKICLSCECCFSEKCPDQALLLRSFIGWKISKQIRC